MKWFYASYRYASIFETDESSCLPRLQVVVPTYVDEFDAVVGDGVEGDGDVLELVVLVLRPLVVPAKRRLLTECSKNL